ncbi:hypothetical protein [Streptomyces sp. NPDC057460]|uniref:LexA family protein n=1 Tax=Streptomyces sp. NPDC057460 TaxID=3346141 RepID=UPI0036B43CF1
MRHTVRKQGLRGRLDNQQAGSGQVCPGSDSGSGVLVPGGGLSPRQESILRVIRNSIIERGEGPTMRQIGECVGLSGTGSIAYQLGRLEALGLISRSGRRGCSCRLGT